MHWTTIRFRACFQNLPESVQKLSKRNFELLKTDPSHPSLHFKKVGKFWSVRAGMDYRALAVQDGDDFVWVWIRPHDEYERMIKQ
jgi:hypothetical protein